MPSHISDLIGNPCVNCNQTGDDLSLTYLTTNDVCAINTKNGVTAFGSDINFQSVDGETLVNTNDNGSIYAQATLSEAKYLNLKNMPYGFTAIKNNNNSKVILTAETGLVTEAPGDAPLLVLTVRME